MVAKSTRHTPPLTRLFTVISERAAVDPPSRGRSIPALRSEAEALFRRLLTASVGATTTHSDQQTHAWLAAMWRSPRANDALRRALVLLADHELNVSTFAVRVTASTGALLSACLLAGLATLTGPLHGGAALTLRSLLKNARENGVKSTLREWLATGQPLPGFGHPLYPEGDPRATAVMCRFKLPHMLREMQRVAEDLTGERPNVDFALVALANAYHLPVEAPFVIFAVSRSVGWLAHALEQITTGQLIRPRVRYIGPALARATSI